MKKICITDTYCIKSYGHGVVFSIENYVTNEHVCLQGDDADAFKMEFDSVYNTYKGSKELDNKLDLLCYGYV